MTEDNKPNQTPESTPVDRNPDETPATTEPVDAPADDLSETAMPAPTPAKNEQSLDTNELVEPVTAPAPELNAEAKTQESATAAKKQTWLIVGAIAIVAVLLLGILYVLDQRGQGIGLFSGIERMQLERSVVATVDGTEISEYDLVVSIDQQSAAASAQGIDVTDPAVAENIRTQALNMLVNTALLKDEAARRGIDVSDQEVMDRYDALVAEVGGEDALRARMDEFGVTDEILRRDINDELVIQQLIDVIFEETEVVVTDEEVAELYEAAGGTEAGLPPITEVEGQIRQQITATKEQEIVNNFVDELRAQADIEIIES